MPSAELFTYVPCVSSVLSARQNKKSIRICDGIFEWQMRGRVPRGVYHLLKKCTLQDFLFQKSWIVISWFQLWFHDFTCDFAGDFIKFFTRDFMISHVILWFHMWFHDFTCDFMISLVISWFHLRFHDFTRDFMIPLVIPWFHFWFCP